MFWNRKKKLPVTKEDELWVNEKLKWLRTEFGEEDFMQIRTVTPTPDFYKRDFDGTEKDAKFILERTMAIMNLNDVEIKLNFFSDDIVKMDDGRVLTTPADLQGKWNSAAGTFKINKNDIIISIETRQLNDPISLIATMAHELSHQFLLGQHRIHTNDEYLTDLTAIGHGFGIFLGNSRFKFSQFLTQGGFGWQSSNQGYLPEQIIAYAMAWLAHERNEKTDYSEFMKKSVKKYFEQSLNYLRKEKQHT